MRGLVHTKGTNRSKPSIYNELDTHKWATKMEIQHLIGGKRDLKLSESPKTRN
jgi:hypothetical protein